MVSMKNLILLALMAVLILSMGCSGGKNEKNVSPGTTSTPEKPGAGEVQLHGTGKCDQCHDAYPVGDIAAGLHKAAFDKQPDIHRNLCSECHDVNSFCGKCHEVPQIVKPE